MKQLRRFMLIGVAALIGLVFCALAGTTQASQPTVKLTTDPAMGQILPFEAEASTPQSPVRLTLQAVDAANQPLQNAKIRLQIFTPPRTPWLTTDFPIVEATKLLEIEAIAPQGELQVQPMLPIRGNYRLTVDVEPAKLPAQSSANVSDFAPFQQTLTLSVPENGVKYRNFALLLGVLLAAGLVGGLVIGGQQKIRPGEIAPERVRLLLSGAALVAIAALLTINLSSLSAHNHASHDHAASHMEHQPDAGAEALLRSQGLELELTGDREATVGLPASLIAQVKDIKTGQPVTDVTLSINVVSLENGWTAFAYKGIPNAAGKLVWQQQFFDGSPHQVQVEVAPQPQSTRQFQPFRVAQEIEVEAIAPPLRVKLVTMIYLALTLLLGIGIGLWWRKKLPVPILN